MLSINSSLSVCFDIDGVLKKGYTAIPGAREALIKLRKKQVQITLITNGGGETELKRAEKLNKCFDLPNEYKIKENELVMCHTPFKNLLPEYKNKTILVSGIEDIEGIIENYGYTNYITNEEYLRIYSHSLPFFLEDYSQAEIEETAAKVSKRLNKQINKNDNGYYEFEQIHSIFILTDMKEWEKNIQVMSDLIISPNGIPGTIDKSGNQFVQCFFAGHDLWFKDKFILNRIGLGGFVRSLEHLFLTQFRKELEFTLMGKPSSIIFDYAKTLINNHENKTLYMIGDNPEVDIQGGKENGFKTILVKTGVFNGNHSSLEHPADYITEDVTEAVDTILKMHNLI